MDGARHLIPLSAAAADRRCFISSRHNDARACFSIMYRTPAGRLSAESPGEGQGTVLHLWPPEATSPPDELPGA